MEWHIGSLNIIGFALSFAATAKSAQLGLHT
jgi:hypothetical protein